MSAGREPALQTAPLPALKTMFPGYFALVMATGIVSIVAHFQGFDGIALALFWANVVFYAVLKLRAMQERYDTFHPEKAKDK